MAKRDVEIILQNLDQAYNRQSWHGTNLRGSLRGLDPKSAAWRPASGRHNIWELIVHCAYWKYVVWRKLTDAERGSFPVEGSNFFPRPEKGAATERALKADLRLLDREHRRLRAAIAGLTTRALNATPAGSKVSTLKLVTGVAAHDLYHAGQIQLLKRLQG